MFIGTSALLQGLGAIVVMPLAPAIFRRTELGQMLALATGLAAACVLLMGALSDPWLWLGIRMILGAATAIAFFGAEHWIVAMAPNLHRSRIVAGYLVAFAVCFGVGPLVLAAVGVEGWPPFLMIAAILALASVPVFLMRRSAPRFRGEVHLSAVPRFALRYPVICLAVLLVAMIEICVLGLLPVWAVQSGPAGGSVRDTCRIRGLRRCLHNAGTRSGGGPSVAPPTDGDHRGCGRARPAADSRLQRGPVGALAAGVCERGHVYGAVHAGSAGARGAMLWTRRTRHRQRRRGHVLPHGRGFRTALWGCGDGSVLPGCSALCPGLPPCWCFWLFWPGKDVRKSNAQGYDYRRNRTMLSFVQQF